MVKVPNYIVYGDMVYGDLLFRLSLLALVKRGSLKLILPLVSPDGSVGSRGLFQVQTCAQNAQQVFALKKEM